MGTHRQIDSHRSGRRSYSLSGFIVFICLMIATSCFGDSTVFSTSQNAVFWEKLEEGLELARIPVLQDTPAGDSMVTILRADPNIWHLRIIPADTPENSSFKNARQWGEDHNWLYAHHLTKESGLIEETDFNEEGELKISYTEITRDYEANKVNGEVFGSLHIIEHDSQGKVISDELYKALTPKTEYKVDTNPGLTGTQPTGGLSFVYDEASGLYILTGAATGFISGFSNYSNLLCDLTHIGEGDFEVSYTLDIANLDPA